MCMCIHVDCTSIELVWPHLSLFFEGVGEIAVGIWEVGL